MIIIVGGFDEGSTREREVRISYKTNYSVMYISERRMDLYMGSLPELMDRVHFHSSSKNWIWLTIEYRIFSIKNIVFYDNELSRRIYIGTIIPKKSRCITLDANENTHV